MNQVIPSAVGSSDQLEESSSLVLTRITHSSSNLIAIHLSGGDFGPVLPSHSAETLSRALATIPLYVRSRASAPSLAKAHDMCLETRVILKQSIFTATSIANIATQLLKMLRDSNSGSWSSEDLKSAQDNCNVMLSHGYAFLKLLDRAKDVVSQVAGDLNAEIVSGEDSAKRTKRWNSTLRATALCATGQSFVAAVSSTAYSTTNPPLSQGLGIASAAVGIVGNIIPFIAQWYLERKDNKPHREDLQSVYIETNRLIYPLHLVHAWWTWLVTSLKSIRVVRQLMSEADYAIEKYEKVLLRIPQYNKEIMSILNSVDDINSIPDVVGNTACVQV